MPGATLLHPLPTGNLLLPGSPPGCWDLDREHPEAETHPALSSLLGFLGTQKSDPGGREANSAGSPGRDIDRQAPAVGHLAWWEQCWAAPL